MNGYGYKNQGLHETNDASIILDKEWPDGNGGMNCGGAGEVGGDGGFNDVL